MTSDDDKWNRLTAWMQDLSQGQWKLEDQKVTFREVPDLVSVGAGRGLFATQDIEPGSTILTIPAVTLLHPRNIERADHQAQTAKAPSPLTVPYRMLPHSAINKRPGGTAMKQVETRITTTEALALYLSLNRPLATQTADSAYRPWAAYLDALPVSFRPWHPLTWLVKPPSDDANHQDWDKMNDLAENYLPKTAYDKLQGVLERYKRHAAMLRNGVPMVLQEEPEEKLERRWSQVTEEDLLWGWLNVNTRTLYLQLDMPPIPNTAYADRSVTGGRTRTEPDSEQQNHAMAPLLDLANHSHLHMENGYSEADADASRRPQLCAVHLVEESATTSSKSGIKSDAPPGWRKRTFEVSAPKNAGIKKGDEIVFAYGPHSDETLFAEYGFVPLEGENPWNEVVVDDLINAAWQKRETRTMVALKSEVLEMNGYLDEYTMHAYPSPPHPSYRLLTALRLMYIQVPEAALQKYIDNPTNKEVHPALQAFLELLMGALDKISDDNEKAVRDCIRNVCLEALERIEQKLTALQLLHQPRTFGDVADAIRMVERLWVDNQSIFHGVMQSIDQGVIF
ncbi:hypothetical protein QFC21_002916 [Naganishia friedmannii]|uniref:Uncharacterized protein n=1 Tax=Naganishia friedmannii TaxID=89922 RepID=A0ACC2VTR8_9TREE|nr:hypothetical protein QFC21_002916 [Naganishia friedmannii]